MEQGHQIKTRYPIRDFEVIYICNTYTYTFDIEFIRTENPLIFSV